MVIFLNFRQLFSSLECSGIENRVIGSLTINHNDIDASNSNRSWIKQSVLNELFLDSYLEFSVFLLQFLNNVVHILLDLVLFFNFKSAWGFSCEFGVLFIFLFANQYLEVVQLWWEEITLDGGQLIGILTIISFYLHQPFQIVLLIHIEVNLSLARSTNRQHFSLVGTLIRRQKLWFFRSTIISKAIENTSSWAVYRPVAVHVFYLVASLGGLRISVFFFGESVLLNLDLPLSILLLELFVTHLNEHVVIDFVWSAALEFSGDSWVYIILLAILFLRDLVILLLMTHHIPKISSVLRRFPGLFIFLSRITRWVKTVWVGRGVLNATDTYSWDDGTAHAVHCYLIILLRVLLEGRTKLLLKVMRELLLATHLLMLFMMYRRLATCRKFGNGSLTASHYLRTLKSPSGSWVHILLLTRLLL